LSSRLSCPFLFFFFFFPTLLGDACPSCLSSQLEKRRIDLETFFSFSLVRFFSLPSFSLFFPVSAGSYTPPIFSLRTHRRRRTNRLGHVLLPSSFFFFPSFAEPRGVKQFTISPSLFRADDAVKSGIMFFKILSFFLLFFSPSSIG